MNAPRPPVRIRIREVPAAAGIFWIRRGLRAFMRQPGGFIVMFLLFLFAMLLLAIALSPAPPVAQYLGVILLPLLSLGYMIGTEAVMNDLPVRPTMLFDAIAPDGPARRALAYIGLFYVASFAGVYLIGDSLDGGEARRWMETALAPQTPGAPVEPPPLSAMGVFVLFLRSFGVSLVSLPLWHAPALIHWGRQGVAQAMFSSIVALWRTRAAFAVYVLSGCALMLGCSVMLALVTIVVQSAELALLLALPLGLVGCVVFYVTLWFGFVDTFEITPLVAAPAAGDRSSLDDAASSK